MQAVEHRFGPNAMVPSEIEWVSDNGGNTAAETCSFARALGLKPATTPISSPEQWHGRGFYRKLAIG
jgi:putative transposase